MPNALITPQITINTPSGSKLVDNPLFDYKFNPLPGSPQFPQNGVRVDFFSNLGLEPEFLSDLTFRTESQLLIIYLRFSYIQQLFEPQITIIKVAMTLSNS
jgi:hypothetical protein